MKKYCRREAPWNLRQTILHFLTFSLEQIKEAEWTVQAFTYDLHHNEEMNKGNIMTEYEEKFSQRGNPINKLIAVRR